MSADPAAVGQSPLLGPTLVDQTAARDVSVEIGELAMPVDEVTSEPPTPTKRRSGSTQSPLLTPLVASRTPSLDLSLDVGGVATSARRTSSGLGAAARASEPPDISAGLASAGQGPFLNQTAVENVAGSDVSVDAMTVVEVASGPATPPKRPVTRVTPSFPLAPIAAGRAGSRDFSLEGGWAATSAIEAISTASVGSPPKRRSSRNSPFQSRFAAVNQMTATDMSIDAGVVSAAEAISTASVGSPPKRRSSRNSLFQSRFAAVNQMTATDISMDAGVVSAADATSTTPAGTLPKKRAARQSPLQGPAAVNRTPSREFSLDDGSADGWAVGEELSIVGEERSFAAASAERTPQRTRRISGGSTQSPRMGPSSDSTRDLTLEQLEQLMRKREDSRLASRAASRAASQLPSRSGSRRPSGGAYGSSTGLALLGGRDLSPGSRPVSASTVPPSRQDSGASIYI